MEVDNKKIDFQDVEGLIRRLGGRRTSRRRFRLGIPFKDCANGIYAAMSAEIQRRGQEMILDQPTKEHIEKAAEWLIGKNDKVGLMLRGDVGNGKTSLMRAIGNLISFVTEEMDGYSKRKVVPEWSARKIALLCGDEQGRKEYRNLFELPMLAIDELGEEPSEIISYGMIYEPLKDLLLERYNRQLLTIVTTNLNGDRLREKYTNRVYDRLKEMMAIINYLNPSYRK